MAIAFSKKTWKKRTGTGLNKFTIGDLGVKEILPAPDSVTQQGDAFTSTNMNDLETRIKTAFDSGVPVTRTINDKALNSDITIAAKDLGAFPVPVQKSTASRSYTSEGTYNYTMPFTLAVGDCIAYQITLSGSAGSSSSEIRVNVKLPSGGTYLDTNLYIVSAGGSTKETISWTGSGSKTISGYLYRMG